MTSSRFKIGTRGSPLALAQANETRDKLIAAHGLAPDEAEIVVITTTGDRIRDRPLADIGGKGLFTKEIEDALLDGRIDLAVHSMKDMPAKLPDGLIMACLLEREDSRDAFLSTVCGGIDELPEGATVGSSSVRRVAQIKHLRPDVNVVGFRGNADTRLRKLKAGQADATFLACAGLNRLGLACEITEAVDVERMLPAVAQGAVGIEIRDGDERTASALQPLSHRETEITVAAERGFLMELDGSCRTPLAGHATLSGDSVSLHAMALTLDGSESFAASRTGPAADAEAMGRDAASEIRKMAGTKLQLS